MPRLAAAGLVLAFILAACSSSAATPPDGAGAPDAGALLAYELTDVRSGETFTLAELSADQPVILETMAIWCTTCLSQQREVVQAHELAEFHSVGIDVDPNEDAGDLAEYAERQGFDWRFVKADAELVKLLTDRHGFGVTNPPSTPTFVVSDGEVRALEFGRVRSAEELVAELGAG
ncbi:MAG: TlpA family protein disulfide reductase [Candidatus Limnocylindria bacterium]